MSIVSTVVNVGPAESDGRHWTEELHTDHIGVVYRTEYLAGVGADTAALATARATLLEEILARREFEEMLGGA